MADGSKRRVEKGSHYLPLVRYGVVKPAPNREHSVMVVRACGREWVIAPWRPKCSPN